MQPAIAYHPQFERIFSRNPQLSNIKPSVWAEQNVVIPGKGKLNYDFNPYCRKIIDMLAPDHHARKIAVMKGSQITFSSGVIMPALGYIIQEDPRNTILMVGATDLIKPASEKLDLMIHGAKLQSYLSHAVQRKRNTKTGDTDEIKSFGNGYIKIASNSNSKAIAQIDLARIFLDDFDAMKGKDKATGSLLDLIEMRAASNLNDYKLVMISTPLEKVSSNIEPAFLAGNQEKYFLECPCCHDPIIIKWTVNEGDIINPLKQDIATNPGGMRFERDNHGRLKKKTVGYVCYKCGGFFDDRNKQKMLRGGIWEPTAVPISDDYFSFHIPSLYAPVGMFDWTYYAGKWVEANPLWQNTIEEKMKVLQNTCFGETSESEVQAPKATTIMKNQRAYEIGVIPESLSIKDGNGRIVLLTCGSDMNGKIKGVNKMHIDDARLDWDIVAHAENGATYRVAHGSIGTFVRGEGDNPTDRLRWTYQHNQPHSVWPVFRELISKTYKTDTGRPMMIGITGLDSGFGASVGAYPFLDSYTGMGNHLVGLKGNKEEQFSLENKDARLFAKGLERPTDLYLLQVGLIKDKLSQYMNLQWHKGEPQPSFFMNFPNSANGLYGYENYFEHFEAEHRTAVTDKDGVSKFRWVKKRSDVANHQFDIAVYNIALRDIFLARLSEERKVKNMTWEEFATLAVHFIEAKTE